MNATRDRKTKSVQSTAKFQIAPINANTWIVAYSHALLPGAVLRTKKAALDYVFALAKAAAFGKVNVEVTDVLSFRAS